MTTTLTTLAINLGVAAVALIGFKLILAPKKANRTPPTKRAETETLEADLSGCKAQRVLTDREAALFRRLRPVLADDNILLAQVAMSAVVRVPHYADRNLISQKYLDFVVCDRNFNALLVIELDDGTHDSAKRQKADSQKDAALKAAGIGLIRTRDEYDIERILEKLKNLSSADGGQTQ